MPLCYRCNRPIAFVRERPEYVSVGTYTQPREIIKRPGPFPIDVMPNNADGTVALYDSPFPIAGETGTFARRIYHEAAKAFRRLGGSLYTSHFETCPGRRT